MSVIEFKCPGGHTLKAKPELAGKLGKCPKCGQSFRVPFPHRDSPAPVDKEPVVEQPVKSGTSMFDGMDFPDAAAAEPYPDPFAVLSAATPTSLSPTAPRSQGTARSTATTKSPPGKSSQEKGSSNQGANSRLRSRSVWIAVGVASLSLVAIIVGVAVWNIRPASNQIDGQGATAVSGDMVAPDALAVHDDAPTIDSSTRPEGPKIEGRFQLLERADYFARNPKTGALATVSHESGHIYLYPNDYFSEAKVKVIGPVVLDGEPSEILFKSFDGKEMFLVGDRLKPQVRCLDANSLALVKSIKTPGKRVLSLTSATEDTPWVYFLNRELPPDNTRFGDSFGELDLRDPTSARIISDDEHIHMASIKASRSGAYICGNFETNSPHVFSLPNPNEGGLARQIIKSTPLNHIGILTDPQGTGTLVGPTYVSLDLRNVVHSYSFSPQCFLNDKPYVVGIDADDPNQNELSYSLSIAGTESPKVLHRVPVNIGDGTGQADPLNLKDLNSFKTGVTAFHDTTRNRVLFAFRDWVRSFSLAEFDLKESKSNMPVFQGVSQIRYGSEFDASLTIPSDPNAIVTFEKAPEGFTLANGKVRWNPSIENVGELSLPVKWQSDARSGTTNITLNVIGISPPQTAGLTEKVTDSATKARVSTVEGVTLIDVGFQTSSIALSDDEKHAVLWHVDRDHDDPSTMKGKTHLSVYDVAMQTVNGSWSVPELINAVVVDEHYVYLRTSSKVSVFDRKNQTLKTTMPCRPNADFRAVDNRFFISESIYSVPELTIVHSAGSIAIAASHGPLDQFYAMNETGPLINGYQYDSTQKNIVAVKSLWLMGQLFQSRMATNRNTQANPNKHPRLAAELAMRHLSQTDNSIYLSVIQSLKSGQNQELKKWIVQAPIKPEENARRNPNRRDSLPTHVFGKSFSLSALDTRLYQIDFTSLELANLKTLPTLQPQPGLFRLNRTGPTSITYSLHGGVPPYQIQQSALTVEREGAKPGQKSGATLDGDKLTLVLPAMQKLPEYAVSWIRDEAQKRFAKVQQTSGWTGFERTNGESEKASTFDEAFEEYVRAINGSLMRQLKITSNPNSTWVPYPVAIAACDANGNECGYNHWLFLNVTKQELKEMTLK